MLRDALLSLEQSTGKPRVESDDGEDHRADRYVAKLREYPGDIVLWVLATWDDQPSPLGEFFPRWSPLKQVLDAKFVWRRKLLPAVQACVPFDRVRDLEPQETPEERAEIVAGLQALARKLGGGLKRDTQLRSPATDRLERMREAAREEAERQLHPERFE